MSDKERPRTTRQSRRLCRLTRPNSAIRSLDHHVVLLPPAPFSLCMSILITLKRKAPPSPTKISTFSEPTIPIGRFLRNLSLNHLSPRLIPRKRILGSEIIAGHPPARRRAIQQNLRGAMLKIDIALSCHAVRLTNPKTER
jgi:hypothetical protein